MVATGLAGTSALLANGCGSASTDDLPKQAANEVVEHIGTSAAALTVPDDTVLSPQPGTFLGVHGQWDPFSTKSGLLVTGATNCTTFTNTLEAWPHTTGMAPSSCNSRYETEHYYYASIMGVPTPYNGTLSALPLATLAQWKAWSGIPAQNAGETLDAYRTRSNTLIYYNYTGLRLGRELACGHFTDTNGQQGQACYVSNYGEQFGDEINATADAALSIRRKNTVCISYRPSLPAGKQVNFYVYDRNDNLASYAGLDDHGDRPVPGICTNCHSGTYDPVTHLDSLARFLPPDPYVLHFPSSGPYTMAAQLPVVQNINNIIYTDSYVSGANGPSNLLTPLQQSEVQALYSLPATATTIPPTATVANNVPTGWNDTQAHMDLYRTVIKPTCQTCHSASIAYGANFTQSFANASANAYNIRRHICDDAIGSAARQTFLSDAWGTGGADAKGAFTRGCAATSGCHAVAQSYPQQGFSFPAGTIAPFSLTSGPDKTVIDANRPLISYSFTNISTTHLAAWRSITQADLTILGGYSAPWSYGQRVPDEAGYPPMMMPQSAPAMKAFWSDKVTVTGQALANGKTQLLTALGLADCALTPTYSSGCVYSGPYGTQGNANCGQPASAKEEPAYGNGKYCNTSIATDSNGVSTAGLGMCMDGCDPTGAIDRNVKCHVGEQCQADTSQIGGTCVKCGGAGQPACFMAGPFTGSGANGGSGTTCLASYTFPTVAGGVYTIADPACTGDSYVKVSGTCTCANDDGGGSLGLCSSCTCTAASTGTATICASTYSTASSSWTYNVGGPRDHGACGSLYPAGEFATWAGKVNVHRPTAGAWTVDSDCSSGSGVNTIAYCQKFWPQTTALVSEAVTSTAKPFTTAGCATVYPSAGQAQFACCAP